MSSSARTATPVAANPKLGFISMGCTKALVDSERTLTQRRIEGCDQAPTDDDTDVVVVNPSGFIDSAATELLDAIARSKADAPAIDALVQIQDGRDAGR